MFKVIITPINNPELPWVGIFQTEEQALIWLNDQKLKTGRRPERTIEEVVDSNAEVIELREVVLEAEATYEIVETNPQGLMHEEAFTSLRAKRDEYLQKTDFTQLADSPFSSEVKALYRAYRTYLRGLPSLHNETSILSAQVMTFEEYNE